jgi:UDP-N-acetylmuramyl pentapeptide phosphotransferase/UDP-N-acetylglucosamine-1-phosphate transferase
VARSPVGRLLVAGLGALAARQALTAIKSIAAQPATAETTVPGSGAAGSSAAGGPMARINYRGRTVSLAGGPALALGATVAAAAGAGGRLRAAVVVAGTGAGLVGFYDDIAGARPGQGAKGFRGHLTALAEGRVTSGLIKIVGVGVSGLAAAALLDIDGPAHRRHGRDRRVAVDVLLGAGVIAGTANLLNLLDLRPGRALKAGLLVATPIAAAGGRAAGVAAGAVGAAAGLLSADLDEEIMLGDAGANALGALLGTALAARTGTAGRAALFACLAALTAASERVSFTQVINRTPVLRELDALGRRTD